MVGRTFVATVVLGLLTVTAAGVGAAPGDRCGLGGRYFARSVKAYSTVEHAGYADYKQFRGAEVFVPAQPGLTAEWLQRVLSYQVATGECDFGVRDVAVSV